MKDEEKVEKKDTIQNETENKKEQKETTLKIIGTWKIT